ncbi:hypothetical protein EGK62_32405 [Pseudomonas aeruginosa]|nr:hypothetical protein EGJ96_25075 [Pseudomonas aeruginosa]RRX98565.1 hypothetical protein EGK62_32405 [Pseudomonas aeruginosa]RTA72603.1 hypothetical protein EJ611_21825 [Pseudomonas aeruginosa]RTB08488.1 hypothetical protein EJ609_18685 [Pseudomonas aeruginosa]
MLHRDTRQTVGNEFNGGGHGHLPGRFAIGPTLVAFVAFVNLVALMSAYLAEPASQEHRPGPGARSPSNPFQRVPH